LTDPKDTSGFENALQNAERAAASRDPATEVELYSELVGQYPREHVPFFRRALARRSLGQCEQAIRDLDEAILLQPEEPAFLFFRGMWKLDLGEYERAIEDLARAEHFDAVLSSTYYQLPARFLQVVALVLANRLDEARRLSPTLPEDYKCFAAGRLWTTKQLRAQV
jgi:tetratricopeptide (TPR) repeat protein